MTHEQFISNLTHWNSYLPFLWLALENTSGDVIELGMGDGSTEKLHEYCKHHNRKLYSYESDLEWYKKFERFRTKDHEIIYVGNNWEPLYENHREHVAVLFSDEAPGEMRKYNISMFSTIADVVVAHDAEPSNDHGYKFSLIKPLFQFHKLHDFPGASTIALSNYVHVYKWSNMTMQTHNDYED